MNNFKYSTDVWFCAFLMHKGHKIVSYEKILKNKVKCCFDITDKEWQLLKVEFNNSEIIKFKGLIEQIKDLLY